MGTREENLCGFNRKVLSLLKDKELTQKIIDLIPDNVILPLYYRGKVMYSKSLGRDIIIDKVEWKDNGYVYFFIDDYGNESYVFENDLD